MSKFETNYWNTSLLALNIMERCARHCGKDIHNDDVAEKLYWICDDLEDWPEDEGFGSSDAYSYLKQAEEKLLGLEAITKLHPHRSENQATLIRKGLDIDTQYYLNYFQGKVYIRNAEAELLEVVEADDEAGLIRQLAQKKYKYSFLVKG